MSLNNVSKYTNIEDELNYIKLLLNSAINSKKEAIVWAIDRDMRLIYFNEVFSEIIMKLFNYDVSPGDNAIDIITVKADRDKAKTNYELSLSGITHTKTESYGKSGNQFFETTYSPINDNKSNIIGVSCFSIDITELQGIQKELKKSEFFFKESQRAALIGSYQSEFYPEDHWVTSEVCDQIFGMGPDYEKTVKGWTELLHPDNAEEMIRYVTEDVINKGVPFNKEYKIIRNIDGKTRWVWGLGNTIKDETGRTTGLIGTIQDITEKKLAENKINTLKKYLSNIIDSMPSILIGVDNKKNITQWNLTATKVYKTSVNESMGKPITSINSEMSQIADLIDETISHGKTITKNRTIERYGNKYHEAITVFPIQSEDDSGAVIRIDDITKEKELQDKLNQSQKMEAIGQLAGGVAHDFNNLLGGIIGISDILLSTDSELNEKNRKFVKMILKASTRASDLTSKLLAFGRKNIDNYFTFDIHECIKDTASILKSTLDKRISLTTDFNAEQPLLLGDISAIQNAFMNLAINASHAMEQKGEISFKTRNIFFDKNYCTLSPFDIEEGDFIEVEIRDTGCGILQENINKIFEPFYTTKKLGEGTGLGLAAVYGTIQDHHGVINVYSEIGSGTVFHLYLPCSKNNEIDKITSKNNILKGTGTILLVDDEELIRTTAKYQMEEMGYTVILANNGKQAVDIFKKRSHEVDLVISDMIMPEMNGSETFRKLKEIDKDCLVVISSGYAKDESLQDLKAEGLAGFIQKPFRINELNQLINSVLK